MAILSHPAFGPRTALIYVTTGTLLDVWTTVWYFAFARQSGSPLPNQTWFWLTGFIFVLGGEINALLEHESEEGKTAGARAPGEAPPPAIERPSIAAPGAAKTAETAERSKRRLWRRWRKSPA